MTKILMVDDQEQVRRIYLDAFRCSALDQFEVFEASDAWAAAQILMSESIDILLLDIRLPQVTGYELFNTIDRKGSDVTIIVTSVFPVYQQKRLIPRADDYFDKSEGPLKLLEKVKQYTMDPAH